MKKSFTILTLLLAGIAFGQQVSVDTFQFKKSEKIKDIGGSKMNYPLVRLADKEIAAAINTDIQKRFTRNGYLEASLDSMLIKWADDLIVFLDFEVTYQQNDILSLNISGESCGAYCTRWTDYFNYSTKSGTWLPISKVIKAKGAFRTLALEDKALQYEHQKEKLKSYSKDPERGLSQEDYEVVLTYYDTCANEVDLSQYALYPERIQIIEDCGLPHVMQALAPTITLSYAFADIRNYLKIKP